MFILKGSIVKIKKVCKEVGLDPQDLKKAEFEVLDFSSEVLGSKVLLKSIGDNFLNNSYIQEILLRRIEWNKEDLKVISLVQLSI